MKKQATLLPKIAALSVLAAFAAPVMAQQAGDNIVSAGWFHIVPQDSSTGITVASGTGAGTYTSTAHSAVSNGNTLGLALTHFFTDNIAVTLDGGIPPEFTLYGKGSLASFGEIGNAKQWSPAVVAKYYFGSPQDKFRPFVGAGVSYITYSDVHLSNGFQQYAGGESVNSALTGGTASASLSSSVAPVISAGATYNITDRLSIGLSVSYLKFKTDATITGNTTATAQAAGVSSTIVYKTSITINPVVSFVSLGYKF